MTYDNQQQHILDCIRIERKNIENLVCKHPVVAYTMGSTYMSAIIARLRHYNTKMSFDDFDREVVKLTEENQYLLNNAYLPAYYQTHF